MASPNKFPVIVLKHHTSHQISEVIHNICKEAEGGGGDGEGA